jgi:TatD DNase family protein
MLLDLWIHKKIFLLFQTFFHSMIFDTHSHCYWDSLLPNIDDIVQKMKEHNITHAVQIGCDSVSSQKAIDLARRFPGVFYATVGIHPETSQNMSFSEIDMMMNELEELYIKNKEYVKAIGECGLDHHYLSLDSDVA